MASTWDPGQYGLFAGERSRPFVDLLAQVRADDPRLVVDLGCGNGPLTLSLASRWPNARVVGVDSSAAMLDAARELDVDRRVQWVEADVARWEPASLGVAPDVIVTNATLQWVPDHLALLDRWARALADGGWLALQVPGNLRAPSHALMREVAATHPAADRLRPALDRLDVAEPEGYLATLGAGGLDVDAWETTYLHVLDPEGRQANPVLEWVKGTGLRPVLAVLEDEGEREAYLRRYDELLREAYPRTELGVVFPFRRIFAVGRRPARQAASA